MAHRPPQLHRIVTSTERARTEPAPSTGGFMRSVMGRHDLNDFDDGMEILFQPKEKITQREQDALDENARKRAIRNLVNTWQERLQLISVIISFFASTEAAILVNTKPATPGDWGSGALKASNASLLGALIMHVYAAILSFLGAFLLIRSKLKEATREEMIVEGIKTVNSPLAASLSRDVERDPTFDLGLQVQQTFTIDERPLNNTAKAVPGSIKKWSYPIEPPIISKNPRVEHVGPFTANVSSHLLSRVHSLCVSLASAGFVLAIVGILCYAWASQPTEVSIFASTCFGGVLLAMVLSLLRKD